MKAPFLKVGDPMKHILSLVRPKEKQDVINAPEQYAPAYMPTGLFEKVFQSVRKTNSEKSARRNQILNGCCTSCDSNLNRGGDGAPQGKAAKVKGNVKEALIAFNNKSEQEAEEIAVIASQAFKDLPQEDKDQVTAEQFTNVWIQVNGYVLHSPGVQKKQASTSPDYAKLAMWTVGAFFGFKVLQKVIKDI